MRWERITKINLNGVASYKTSATLQTNKKVNLIYGLNGTGKSTLSDYLHQQTNEKYKNCSVEGLGDDHEILVYNQTFIRENFFEAENVKGIFTLSKENKDAEIKIENALCSTAFSCASSLGIVPTCSSFSLTKITSSSFIVKYSNFKITKI